MTRRQPTMGVDALERRDVPAALFGNALAGAETLTISFAGDGTPVTPAGPSGHGQGSDLFAQLNARMPTPVWQGEILRAFQTWAAAANINLGLVPDNGAAFGAEGADNGRAAAADIRVGGFAQSGEVAAINSPSHVLSGRAGTVLLNTAARFTSGANGDGVDLYTAVLNEAANIFGLADTDDPDDARYGQYIGPRSGLSRADWNAIVSMYGARTDDLFEAEQGNDLQAAARLTFAKPPGPDNALVATVNGTIVSTDDADLYRLTTLGGTTRLFVSLNTAGRSLFTGRVELLDMAGNRLAERHLGRATDKDLTFDHAVTKNTTYFVRVTAARDDTFGVGSYRLRVGLNQDSRDARAPSAPSAPSAPTAPSDGFLRDASLLSVTAPGFAAGTRFVATGSLNGPNDRDAFAVRVPHNRNPLTVILAPGKSFQIRPDVMAFRADNVPLPVSRLVQNDDGRWVAQFDELKAGETVRLVVTAAGGNNGNGAYALTADFNTAKVKLQDLVRGNTSHAEPVHQVKVTVAESTVFHFRLDVRNDARPGTGTHIRATIRDGRGRAVARVTAGNGLSTAEVYLPAGTYTVTFRGVDAAGKVRGGATYCWSLHQLTDPIEVYSPTTTAGTSRPTRPTRPTGPTTASSTVKTPVVTVAAPPNTQQSLILQSPWSAPMGW